MVFDARFQPPQMTGALSVTWPAMLSLKDPRLYQILALASLLAFGWIARAFEIAPLQFGAILLTALAAQWLGAMVFAVRFEARSAIVTALSLTLLLRADGLWPLMLAAAIAIGSKFALRIRGKHLFNPANIGIVAAILLTDAAWTTPGQWGTAVWLAALIAGAGFFVTYRASRIDVPLVFLAAYAALLVGRALWLGDPIAIPLNRLQNGALILFAFFMISDPKTTPDGPLARAVFVVLTAIAAFVLQFNYFNSDGIFLALAGMCALRPLIEIFDRAPRYQWGDAPPGRSRRPAGLARPAPAE
jgi:Na+-transporting NADH:ubiquinone oxidoreductase subunit NqrB